MAVGALAHAILSGMWESQPDLQTLRRLAAQGNFGAVNPKNPRVAPGSAQPRGHGGAGQKTKLHQAACIVSRQFDRVQNRSVSALQVYQGAEGFRLPAVATQLHLGFSMEESEILVNTPGLVSPFFCAHRYPQPSKCTRIEDIR